MKKRVMFLVMSMCILMLIGGCAKKEKADDLNKNEDINISYDTDDSETPTGAAVPSVTPGASQGTTTVEIPKKEDYNPEEYIKLAQYKGVEVTVEKIEVTEADIDAAINEDLSENATKEDVTGRAVKTGDIVIIDFEGILDGVAFEGGSAQDYELVIGSGSFVEGFEEGIIGANIGDKLALDITFPENYYEELAGKAVVFNVTVKAIKQSVTPELTEEYVKENTDYESIEAYREGVRKELQEKNEKEMNNEKIDNAFKTIIATSEIISLPKTLTDYYTAQRNYQITQEATYSGVDLETYVTGNGVTMDDFNAMVTKFAEDMSTQELVLCAVAKAEKMEVTDEEYKEEVEYTMTTYDIKTEEELFAVVTEAEIKSNLLLQKAYNFIVDNTVVK